MNTENRKRKTPIFQESGSIPPSIIYPPFQAVQEPEIDSEENVEGIEEPEINLDDEIRGAEPHKDDNIPELEVQTPDLALTKGWKLLSEAQQDGKTYLVTHNFYEPGVKAFWRKTRILSHFRWALHGKWSSKLTRSEVLPQPLYYKELG